MGWHSHHHDHDVQQVRITIFAMHSCTIYVHIELMSACNRPSVVLFGDSITQFSFSREHNGWGAGLADWYQRSADVFNRGFGGYNSSELWALFSE